MQRLSAETDGGAIEAPLLTRELAGAVLAGGRSRRFGRDKSGYRYRGRSLLERALSVLDGSAERMVVLAARPRLAAHEAGAPPGIGPPSGAAAVRFVRDARPGFGALSGLHAALTHATRPWVAVVACDMPFLPGELWPELMRARDDVRLVVPEGPRGLEPLAALYHRELLGELEVVMDRGGAPLRSLPERVSARVVPWEQLRARLPETSFLNANRPEDLP